MDTDIFFNASKLVRNNREDVIKVSIFRRADKFDIKRFERA